VGEFLPAFFVYGHFFSEPRMPLTSQGIEARLRALAGEVAARSGYDLVDLEYRREPGGWTVRLFIDRPGGVTLEDCQRISQEFGTILEVEDPIPHQYQLEVSSPGLDRPLRKVADFVAAKGKRVRITTREPLDGQRNFPGQLEEVVEHPEGATLRIRDASGRDLDIPAAAVERAHIVYEWPELAGQGSRKGRKPGKKR
jgi:ribosome maturation factor RimP